MGTRLALSWRSWMKSLAIEGPHILAEDPLVTERLEDQAAQAADPTEAI